MNIKSSLSLALLLSLIPGITFAQRPRGGGGGGAQQRQQAQRSTGVGAPGQMQGQGTQDRIHQQQRDRLHTQLTTQQRDQYKDCSQTMDRLRTQTRDMARVSTGAGFNPDHARQQQIHIREQFRNLEQTRTQLGQSLSDEQRAGVQQRMQNMERLRDRIESRLGNMDKELSNSAPNARRFAEQARLTDREMNAYRNQFRQMGDELGIQLD